MFRVTTEQTTRTFIAQIFRQQHALEKTRSEVGSGVRVSRPADDPAQAGTIAKFQHQLDRLKRHEQRVAGAIGTLETQESILGSTQNLLLRAKELATQAANETLSPEARASMADEVFQLRDAIVALANTQYQGSYLYAGAADNTAPFALADAATGGYTNPGDPNLAESQRYVFTSAAGATQTRTIQMTDSDALRITTSGGAVFANSIAALERLGRALKGYETEPLDGSTLPTGAGGQMNFPDDYAAQTEQIRATIDLINAAMRDDIEVERTNVGGRLSRLEQARELLGSVKFNTESARANLQDIDLIEAASMLNNLEVSLQALLVSGARLNSLTLLNFI